jgi:hypothetical protein
MFCPPLLFLLCNPCWHAALIPRSNITSKLEHCSRFLCEFPALQISNTLFPFQCATWPVSVAVGNAARRYSVHTCPPTLFIDSFPVHKDTATTACEGLNAGLKDCKWSLQQITRLDDFKSRVTTIFDINFERSKLARFVKNIDAANSWLRRGIRERQAS